MGADQNPLDVEAIRARLDAATPGPWESGDVWARAGLVFDDHHNHVGTNNPTKCGYCFTGDPLILAEVMDINGRDMEAHLHRRVEPWDLDEFVSGAGGVVVARKVAGEANVELIAHAPADLRRLLDENARLNAEFADFREMAVLNSKAATEAVDRSRSECAALAAKVAELEGESRLVQARAAGWDEGYKAGCESDPDSLLPGNNPYRDGSGMPHTPAQEAQGPLERPETDGYCDGCGVPTTTIGDQPWHTGHRKYDEYWSDCRDTLRPPRGIKTYTEALVSEMIPADLVTVDPEVQGGEPCMKGTRVQAYLVATLLEDGATWGQVRETYPSVPTPEGHREAAQEAQERPGTREGDTGKGTGRRDAHGRSEADR